MKLANTLEAIALSIDQKATMALADIRTGNNGASRQRFLDIQQAAWAALNELDNAHMFQLKQIYIKHAGIQLKVLFDDDVMFVFAGNRDITDLLMPVTLRAIENTVKQTLIEINTEGDDQ